MSKIQLNILLTLPSHEFISFLGGIYENSPWIVTQFYNEKLSSDLDRAIVEATRARITNVRILFDEIKQYLKNGGTDRQLALLRCYDNLCAEAAPESSSNKGTTMSHIDATTKSPAENMHDNRNLSLESIHEQRRANLFSLSHEERNEFNTLNNQYKLKFQFPFILAVRNASKYTVLSALKGRLVSSIEEEMACALSQVDKIAWMRLLSKVDYSDQSEGHGGFLTCHVLDLINSIPAAGMRVELYRIDESLSGEGSKVQNHTLLRHFITSLDGHLNGPALSRTDFKEGLYEWKFFVGDYFAKYSSCRISGMPFLDVVPLRFGLDDPTRHYHVPLLVSPFSYLMYRGCAKELVATLQKMQTMELSYLIPEKCHCVNE